MNVMAFLQFPTLPHVIILQRGGGGTSVSKITFGSAKQHASHVVIIQEPVGWDNKEDPILLGNQKGKQRMRQATSRGQCTSLSFYYKEKTASPGAHSSASLSQLGAKRAPCLWCRTHLRQVSTLHRVHMGLAAPSKAAGGVSHHTGPICLIVN